MIPWELLDREETDDGAEVTLHRRGQEYVIRAGGRDLMSSRVHGSEEVLATLGCGGARRSPRPRVLVGGLGMGFTLRATLDLLPGGATVVVSELLEAVVSWNRGPLGPLAGAPLDDPRVTVEVGDVLECLGRNPGGFDAVLLDVDNGPVAFTRESNVAIYEEAGLRLAGAALREGGELAVWSSFEDREFQRRLVRCGFSVERETVRARVKKGPRHTIYVARRQAGRPGRQPTS